jgi:chromosome segregation ATPase
MGNELATSTQLHDDFSQKDKEVRQLGQQIESVEDALLAMRASEKALRNRNKKAEMKMLQEDIKDAQDKLASLEDQYNPVVEELKRMKSTESSKA